MRRLALKKGLCLFPYIRNLSTNIEGIIVKYRDHNPDLWKKVHHILSSEESTPAEVFDINQTLIRDYSGRTYQEDIERIVTELDSKIESMFIPPSKK